MIKLLYWLESLEINYQKNKSGPTLLVVISVCLAISLTDSDMKSIYLDS